MILPREEALGLLRKYVKNEKMIAHSLASEAVLGALADQLGRNREAWAPVSYTHLDVYKRQYGNSTMAGLAIGVTLMLIHLVVIPVTGTSVNPARSFGPAIFAGGKALSQLWLFFVAPLFGAIAAALLWKYGFETGNEKD